MKVTEAAQQYGISTQRIYQLISKLPNKGKGSIKGELSADAVLLLQEKYKPIDNGLQNFVQPCEMIAKSEHDAIVSALTQANEAQAAQIAKLMDEIKDLKADKANLFASLDKALTITALPSGKKHWWQVWK